MSDLIGKTLGPYRILEQIGVGGMATVYKAYQPSMDRDIAIKILPHYLSQDAEFVKRFQREARAIAKLEHAHILPVYDYGEHDQTTYIAMRYVQAGTLKERIAKGPLPLDEINRLIGQIGGALNYAHRMGVIHRDVKPGNVLVDAQGDTYLTDFGLARMMEATQQLTASGVGVGTPAYMSPEQGQGIKVDHRSDIYSLGVVLYEMVTGHVPYEAETPMGVVLKHISDPLPLPRKVAPNVPEGVEKVILRALAKDPAHRFQTAGEMVEALNIAAHKAAPEPGRPVVAGAVPGAASISFVTRVQQTWEKPRGKFALISGTVIVLAVLGLLLSQLPGRVQIAAPGATATSEVAQAATAPTVAPTAKPTSEPQPGAAPTEPVKGKRVFYCEGVTPLQICVLDIQSGKITQITKDLKFEGQMGTIAWSPDGARLVFSGAQTASAPEKLFIVNADGTGLKQVTTDSTYDHQAVWSPDGQWIAFARNAGLGLIRPDGTDVHTALAQPKNCGLNAMAWSPDSRRIALMKICSGALSSEVWVVNPDGSDLVVLHSTEPGVSGATMAWSPDGSQLVAGYEIKKQWRHLLLKADGRGEPQEIDWEPYNWDYGFWPQWGGEAATSKPTEGAALSWEKAADAADFLPVALTTLAVDPNDPDTIFAGTYGAGLYISRDGGNTWEPSNDGLGKGTVGQIAVHPKDSSIVYTALFDQGGIYKSTDGGRTWQAINRDIELDGAWNWTGLIYLDPSDPDRLYFTDTTSGLYRSENAGENWSQQSRECPPVTGLVVDPANGDHLYASSYEHPNSTCRAGIYESTDAGRTWTRLTTDEMVAPANQWGGDWWHLAADPHDLRTLYAGGQAGTFKSSDGGKTWNEIQEYCQWLAVHPDDGTVYCGQGGQVQVSRDGGASWSSSNIGAGWGGQERSPFAFVPGTQTLYAGNDEVMKSTDGGATWKSLGWLSAARMRLVIDPRDGQRLFLSTVDNPGQIYRSTNGGETWQVALDNAAPGGRVTIDPAQDVVYYPNSAGFGSELYRSKDNGLTWEQFGKGQPTHGAWQLLPAPQNPQKLWLVGECGTRPAASENSGQTFSEVQSFPDALCQPIMLIDKSGQRMYIVAWGSFYRSDSGGEIWRSLGNVSGIYRSAALDPSDPNVVYLGSTHRGLLKTTNGGQNWSQLSSLPAASVSDIAIDPADRQTLYAATDSGAFVTLDGGEQWSRIQTGLGSNPIVYSIAIDPNDSSKVYAVTPDGVYRLESTAPTATVSNTVLLEEDFEDGKAQDFSADSEWQIVADESGNKVYEIDNRNKSEYKGMTFGSPEWTDYSAEYRVRYLGSSSAGGGSVGLQIRSARGSYYVIDLGDIGELYLAYSLNVSPWTRLETQFPPIERNVWYVIRVEVQGEQIRVYLDDALIIEVNDPQIRKGRLQLFASPSTYAQIDDIRVIGPGQEVVSDSTSATQARAFAEPILQAIADRKPDFADDFSTAEKGWVSEGDPNLEQIAIENGRLRITVGGLRRLTHVINPAVHFNNFVLMVDAITEIQGTNDSPIVAWRGGQHTFVLWTSQYSWETRYCGGTNCDPNYASGLDEGITVGKVMQVMIVARGSAFALYLNGNPLAYVDDPTRPPGTLITLTAFSGSESRATVIAFDNFKIWDISDLP